MKILILSDVHFCHSVWYGITAEKRMEMMVDNLNRAYEKEPYEAILFLGDYSLDFWGWSIGGCYLHDKYSYTDRFVKEVLPKIRCENKYLIPGNHEQYSHEKWKEITGSERQFSLVIGNVLYLMADNFSGDLDPDHDSDGTYTPTDLKFVKAQMEKYPKLPVVLCAHYFDMEKETDEFKAFLKNESRIICLFCGHEHMCIAEGLGAECGDKFMFHCGNYAYASSALPNCMFGWREVTVENGTLKTVYFTPKMCVKTDGFTVECEDTYHAAVTLKLK